MHLGYCARFAEANINVRQISVPLWRNNPKPNLSMHVLSRISFPSLVVGGWLVFHSSACLFARHENKACWHSLAAVRREARLGVVAVISLWSRFKPRGAAGRRALTAKPLPRLNSSAVMTLMPSEIARHQCGIARGSPSHQFRPTLNFRHSMRRPVAGVAVINNFAVNVINA